MDIDDDLLQFAKERARQRGTTTSRVICQLLRDAVAPKNYASYRNGIPVFPPTPGVPKVTVEWVQRALDEDAE